jgi:ATP-dependent RNA/DNA helicase IGHMBP2
MARFADEHFAKLLRCLQHEAAAEAAIARARLQKMSPAEAERTGASLVGLTIRDETTGLGGRALLTLGKRDLSQQLPWTRLNTGSPILLTEEKTDDGNTIRGLVSRRDRQTIEVALAFAPETEAERPTWRIDLSTDEVARERQRFAINKALAAEKGRLFELRTALLGERPPEFGKTVPLIDPQNRLLLNPSQREAIEFALSTKDFAIIHGPPGTGKTTTVAELIRQAVTRGDKVLATAPSNLAVDNLLERLLRVGVKAVRLGHPARVSPELREHTLDLLVENHPDLKVARKLIKEARVLRNQASRFTRARPQPGAKYEMRQEAKELIADARRIEDMVVAELLDGAQALCVTLTGIDHEVIGPRQFNLAVVDEACQSTEPACWIPLLRSQRLILAGDHCQLPPTVISTEATKEGFGLSLQERLIKRFGEKNISRRLTVQYRMHAAIMQFSSQEFYNGELTAPPDVAAHLLCDFPDVQRLPLTETPIDFIDTAGASYSEELEPDGESRRNPEEAGLVVRKVAALIAAGLLPDQIAVISPYAAQVRLLREKLAATNDADGVEVDTVDGFQGREQEVVIISLVRSNNTGEIGFLSDTRRMNVALTRARRKLIVIGDSATIGGHPFYGRLLEYFEQTGSYHTVWEEME